LKFVAEHAPGKVTNFKTTTLAAEF